MGCALVYTDAEVVYFYRWLDCFTPDMGLGTVSSFSLNMGNYMAYGHSLNRSHDNDQLEKDAPHNAYSQCCSPCTSGKLFKKFCVSW